jgi:23S rRNA (pseudouridine1915-N3)-methyltransferase
MEVTVRIVGRSKGGGGGGRGGGGGGGSSSSSSTSSTAWIEDGCAVYQRRLQGSSLRLHTDWSRSDADLVKAVRNDRKRGHAVVMLDPSGSVLSSEHFAHQLYRWLEIGGSRLTFVIGGADGLPKELRGGESGGGGGESATTLVSLSALTFTHQMARLLLFEQIYRASEIRRGSGYHK